MAGDVTKTGADGITAAHWEGSSSAGIKQLAKTARAGEYLLYKFTATTEA